MKLWQTKTWKPLDILSLELAAFVLGIIIGGYMPSWTMANRWLLTVLFVLLAIRPVYAYCIKKD
ncbi:MAG: hypothetical protein ACE5IM_02160 [Nitrospinota bacterium]